MPIVKNDKLLLIKRSKNLKFHAGEIAFPGGIIKNNENPIEAAIRETEEELSIKRDFINVIGILEGVYISRTNFHIIPVISTIEENALKSIRINKDEVEDVILYSFDELVKYRRVIVIGYWYIFASSEGVIWGATARIINSLLKLYGII
ncbi:MAG: CoA pyrophosphatase [candidate division WOR-3 bacterium]|nr:CoA pyrophosphatase [candidate division WOR-3 bacterium]MCX7948215.1 CoA pyrophosphatase [candidate division WOR-3 bacterium]MDW8150017.1 CoA pyrophosphatase [candidate division WOR-3 bacterium]